VDLVGQVLSGYLVERPLGAGAMGEVYLARDPAGQPVVVKLLGEPGDGELRARLQREGEALQRIGPHPHVVAVLSVHALEDPPHLVLEYVEGQDLMQRVRESALPPLEAARIVRDVALGLEAVHRLGLLHRDLKPANVLLSPAGQAKVVDFGLVKDMFQTALTAPGQVLGTAPYMAPECWDPTRPATNPGVDVYALGATLYFLIARRPPFLGRSLDQLADQVRAGDYPPLRSLVPEVPEDLDLVLAHMLAPEPALRYARISEVADDLERVLHGEPCEVLSLVESDGRRLPLLGAKRFVLGSGPAADLRLDHPSVAPAHAQLRRRPDGFELRDLNSPGGTFVGQQRLGRRVLREGDQVRLGDVVLQLRDPRARPRPVAFLDDARRLEVPGLMVQALARAADPRAALFLLERLAPDPLRADAARARLLPLLGPEATRLALEQRAAEAAQVSQAAPALLARLAGRSFPALAGWLAWWDEARTRAPLQAVPIEPPLALALHREADGANSARRLALDSARSVHLVGRDARCHLRVEDRSLSRHHATLLRLHRRVVVRDEGRAAGTRLEGARVTRAFLDPGPVLELGEVRLVLARQTVREPGQGLVDGDTFAALVRLGHPAVADALEELREPPGAWLDELAGQLFEGQPDAARALASETRGLYRRWAETAGLATSVGAGAEGSCPPLHPGWSYSSSLTGGAM
jgi:serine/threonine protein kinase